MKEPKTRVENAIKIAHEQHNGNRRKINRLPEVTHPFKVYRIAKPHTDDEDILIAALLHDVPDDTNGYGIAEIHRDFGENVATIVAGLTHCQHDTAPGPAGWSRRKEVMLERLDNLTPSQALIYTCDKIHDMESLARDCRKYGNAVWDKFNAPPEQKRWYYTRVLIALRNRCPEPELLDRLEKAWQELSTLIPCSFITRCGF